MNINANNNADVRKNDNKYLSECVKKEKAHEDDVNCVLWHPSKNLLISCSDDNSIKLWKIKEILI